jgi:hypothetical protein
MAGAKAPAIFFGVALSSEDGTGDAHDDQPWRLPRIRTEQFPTAEKVIHLLVLSVQAYWVKKAILWRLPLRNDRRARWLLLNQAARL